MPTRTPPRLPIPDPTCRGRFACLLAAAVLLAGAAVQAVHGAGKPRVIVETDAGGDPDDEQSLVRFLLYASDLDIEGIIANRPAARPGENLNAERTGLGIVQRMIRAYGECHASLVRHDRAYPEAEKLLAVTVPGYAGTDAGERILLAAMESADPRPVWFLNWGTDHGSAPSCLKRLLDRMLRERGQAAYAAMKGKLRVIGGPEVFGDHLARLEPPFPLWVDTFHPEAGGKRWYHRFSPLTATAGGFDLERDVRAGHGPLGALYPINTSLPQKEGDTPTFLYLLPLGLGDPEHPSWGSWAGRYGPNPELPGKPAFWANQEDAWEGTRHRDNTLRRWAADFQNDFRARLDWCVKSIAEANHPPRAVIDGDASQEVLRREAPAGGTATFDAGSSADPDGNRLSFRWISYPEAGTFQEAVAISGDSSPRAAAAIPLQAAGKEVHLILAVTDDGSPPLTRHRRIIVAAQPPAPQASTGWKDLEPYFEPPQRFASSHGSYRSPLLFEDGSRVLAAADWPRRRREIERTWLELLGPWPPFLDLPEMRTLSETARDGLAQRRVRVPFGPDQEGEGWLLLPPGAGPFPAVLVVYYEPETSIGRSKEPLRDFGYQLALRGFVTLSIGSPGGDARKPEIGGAVCQPLSYHAYVAANCWLALARLPQVDAARIGVTGHSYGGKWALFAAALWEGFAAIACSDPGIVFDETRPNVNYWEPWYLGLDPARPRTKEGVPAADNPRAGAYREMVAAGRDLHELHALIAPRPFLVSGGSEDPPERWQALHHTAAVNRLLGFERRVGMTNRPAHSPTVESNAAIYAFFEHFLKPANRQEER